MTFFVFDSTKTIFMIYLFVCLFIISNKIEMNLKMFSKIMKKGTFTQ